METATNINNSILPKIALALPFIAFALSWLLYGNPFTLPESDWGEWFMIALIMGGAGISGVILSFVALSKTGGGIAVAALIFNGLSLLVGVGTLLS